VGQAQGGSRRVGRTAIVLGLVLAAASLDLTAGAPSAGARSRALSVDPGFGQAQAEIMVIDPRSAQLSFGVRFGPTVADHRHLVARAEARSVDYGLIGGALTGAGCTGSPPPLKEDQLPQPLRADSRTPGDANETTVQEGAITQSVLARTDPYSQATSRLAEVSIPALFSLDGANDVTQSGVDAQGRATVTAEVRVGKLSILGGLVQLNGLRWYAQHVVGSAASGSFTIGSGSIGGKAIPTQDASAAVQSVNAVLSQLGFVLLPPRSHREADTFFVDPLEIGIAPNPSRDAVTGAVLDAIQPVRQQLFGALIAASCDFEAAITVTDILLGAGTGGGSLTVDLGGAQAQLLPPDDTAPTATQPLSTPVSGGSSLDSVGLPPSGQALGGLSPVGSPGSSPTALHSQPASVAGSASDGALAVGLAVVGLGVVLVEGDRRKMRRALAGRAAVPPSGPLEAPDP
jgi:hypothetical protein